MNRRKLKVTFYCHIEQSVLDVVLFYRQDIEALKTLGYEVFITTRWYKINWRSDVIFIWWWTYAFFPVLIGKILNKKTIITGTFNYRCPKGYKDFYRRDWLQRFLIKFSTKFAGANLLVSKREYIAIKREWKFKNLYYNPHAVDTEIYRSGASRSDHLIFTICWTGKENIRRKCIPEIIESVVLLKKQNSNLEFILAGRVGDGFALVRSLIEKNNLSDCFKLVGELSEEDKIDYLQRCTIYLQPSRYEGFGLAIAEAMSCGAPVISSDVGEVKEVVGNAGVLLCGCSPEEISETVTDLLNNANKRRELGHKARQKIVKDFPKIRRVKGLKKVIEGIKL